MRRRFCQIRDDATSTRCVGSQIWMRWQGQAGRCAILRPSMPNELRCIDRRRRRYRRPEARQRHIAPRFAIGSPLDRLSFSILDSCSSTLDAPLLLTLRQPYRQEFCLHRKDVFSMRNVARPQRHLLRTPGHQMPATVTTPPSTTVVRSHGADNTRAQPAKQISAPLPQPAPTSASSVVTVPPPALSTPPPPLPPAIVRQPRPLRFKEGYARTSPQTRA